ncbi:MAG: LysM peptidoglycan-binding domain-containing protein [Anaerolineae bacterium]|nr:LysM peptidoglycan-binding domain-containing protein [Anaerolineae bacterium]
MRRALLWRALAMSLVLAVAGCYQEAGSSPRSTEPEISPLPARRSDRALALRATSSLPLTMIAPTSPADAPASPTPSIDEESQAFITPGGPEIPSRQSGGGSGFTTFSLPTHTPTPRPPTVDEVSPECVHTVRGGDTLYDIALENDTTVDAMIAANPSLTRNNTLIRPGQQLVIASCPELQDRYAEPTPLPVTAVPAIVVTSLPEGHRLHVVASGETLYDIALTYGLSTSALIVANELPNPDRLDVGQEILIPPRS